MNNRKILVTHTDLDGVGCAVLFHKADPTTGVIFCDITQVENVLGEIYDSGEEIIICDLPISSEWADKLNVRGRVSLIDHHKSAEWCNKYDWASVKTDHCATYHCWKVLGYNYHLEDMEPMVNAVNDHDMWIHDLPRGLDRLQEILHHDAMYSRLLLNSSPILTTEELAIVEADDYVKKLYIDESIMYAQLDTDSEGRKMAMSVGERYISDVGHSLCEEFNIDYAMIVDMRHNKVSLRSTGDCDVSAIAKECGGGGHPHAAGFTMNDGWSIGHE